MCIRSTIAVHGVGIYYEQNQVHFHVISTHWKQLNIIRTSEAVRTFHV